MAEHSIKTIYCVKKEMIKKLVCRNQIMKVITRLQIFSYSLQFEM